MPAHTSAYTKPYHIFLIYINVISQLPCINLGPHLLIRYTHINFSKYISLGGPYWKIEIHSTGKYSSKRPCPLNIHTSSLYIQFFISPKYNYNCPLHYKYAKIWLYTYTLFQIHTTLPAYAYPTFPNSHAELILPSCKIQKHTNTSINNITSPPK